MDSVTNCKFNILDVSNADKEHIGRGFLRCVQDYFKDPEIEKDFKLWQKQRYKKIV